MGNVRHGRRRAFRSCGAVAAAASAVAGGAARAGAQTSAQWRAAAGGSWTDPTKWSTSPAYPNNGTPAGATYAATVGAVGATYTVGLNASIAVSSLTVSSANATVVQSAGTLSLGGGTLDVQAGAYQLAGGTIANAVIQVEGGTFSTVDLTGTPPTLDNVTLAGPVALSAAYLRDGLTLSNATLAVGTGPAQANGGTSSPANLYATGTLAVGGVGRIEFDAPGGGSTFGNTNDGTPGTVTIGPGVTVATGTAGTGGQGTLGGKTPAAGTPYGLVNQGTINVPAGELTLAGAWTNQGTINLSGGTLQLGGTFTTAGIGTLVHTGGQLQLTGTLNNAGQTLNLATTTGPLVVNGGTITGGTIAGTAAVPLTVDNRPVLNGVSLGSDLTVNSGDGGGVTLQGGLPLNGHALTLSNAGNLTVNGPLSGPGTVTVNAAVGTPTSVGGTGFNVAAGVTVQAGVVAGTNTAVGTIPIGGVTPWTNQGTIRSGSPLASVTIAGPWTNAGTLSLASGCGLYLGVTFTTAGIGQLTRPDDGTDRLVITGSVNNAGATLDTAKLGPLSLSQGQVTGGRVAAAAADVTVDGEVFDGVTLAGAVGVTPHGLTVQDGLTLGGATVTVQGSGQADQPTLVSFEGSAQTLGGTGSIVLGGNASSAAVRAGSGTALTVGPGVTLTTTTNGSGVLSGSTTAVAFPGRGAAGDRRARSSFRT